MRHGVEYYDWNGHAIEVETFDARDVSGGIDVTPIVSPAEHPTGRVPEGSIHYLCALVAGNGGFWATEEAFHERAEPLATRAVGFDDEE